MSREMEKGDALLIVDVQNDFCPGGALAVEEGDQVVPVLNEWVEKARQAGAPIYASRDWHPADHCSFVEQGGPWPEHCIQGTPGAEFHPDLRLPDAATIISKGQSPDRDAYSAFDQTELTGLLRDTGVKRLWVGGLAQDVCVKASVIDACEAGIETHLLLPATRAVNVQPGDGERAVEAMREAGARIETDAS